MTLIYLFVNLGCGLRVAEGHGGDVLEDGHLDGAVAAVEKRHQGAAVHGAVGDGAPDGGPVDARALQVRLHCVVVLALLGPQSWNKRRRGFRAYSRSPYLGIS